MGELCKDHHELYDSVDIVDLSEFDTIRKVESWLYLQKYKV